MRTWILKVIQVSDRFTVVKEGLGFRLLDSKTEEFLQVFADYDTLVEVARLMNVMDQKNRCLMKKVDVMSRFVDAEAMNEYWESVTDG